MALYGLEVTDTHNRLPTQGEGWFNLTPHAVFRGDVSGYEVIRIVEL